MNSAFVAEVDSITSNSGRKISPALQVGILIGMPILTILACFPLLSSTFFQTYCDSPGNRRLSVVFQARDQKCDVVIYGDSTAEVDLDPMLITKQTRLTTCNIAVPEAVIEVLGIEPLKRYLAINPRPHDLVLSFSAANLSRPDLRQELSLDGMVLTIRFVSWFRGLGLMMRNPDRILGILSYTYLAGSKQLVNSIRHKHAAPPLPSRAAIGQGTFFVLPTGPLTKCEPFVGSHVLADPRWIASLRKQLKPSADALFVNVSPASTCIDLYSQWSTSLAGATDNDLESYPINLFADTYYHLSGAGATRYSEEVAREILQSTTSTAITSPESY